VGQFTTRRAIAFSTTVILFVAADTHAVSAFNLPAPSWTTQFWDKDHPWDKSHIIGLIKEGTIGPRKFATVSQPPKHDIMNFAVIENDGSKNLDTLILRAEDSAGRACWFICVHNKLTTPQY